MDWFNDTQWLLWLAAALAAGVIEIVTADFVFLMIAGGAVAAGVSAGLGAGAPLQVAVFSLSTVGLLITGRPPLKRWANRTPIEAMNVAALVGRDARVLEAVTDRAGLIKLDGEIWTARVSLGERALEVGSHVNVLRIDGATAMVAPSPAPPGPQTAQERPLL
jgi:membrane protein implicated in regulation of membrane protease activity